MWIEQKLQLYTQPRVATMLIDVYKRQAMLYANLHSQTYPGGEIRGQLIPTLCGVNLPLVVR